MTAQTDMIFNILAIDEHFFTMVIRICIAIVLCGAIGFEREIKHQDAGFRTHMLVGVGACSMMLLSIYGFQQFSHVYPNADPTRIPSYVISSLGFLCAGTIIVRGANVRGLTTAASIWIVACIGLIVGAGMIGIAIILTIIVLISLFFIKKFEKRFEEGAADKNN